MKHRHLKSAVSFMLCAAICFGAMDRHQAAVLADSVSELQAEMEANEAAINEKRDQLEQLQEQSASAQDYLNALSEKMDLQQNNIDLINEQLDQLESDILQRTADIDAMQTVIDAKKAEIDVDIDAFRERLRSMYMSGSDSMAQILTGATDFYDLLARYELINRVAEYDDNMIDGLNEQLDDYNAKNAELNEQKTALEQKKSEAEDKRDVLQGEMNALIDEYTESQTVMDQLISDQQLAQSDIDWLNSQNDKLGDRIEEIKEQERIAAEKARKEAEERRRREEEERQRQEEERRRQEEAALMSASEDSGEVYSYIADEPDYSTEVYTGDRSAIIDYAKTYLGVYYQWCGNYPASGYYGLDCSHFTYRVMEHFGLMNSYMDSRSQCSYCTPISRDELQPGDLVFYQNSSGRVEHVTIYIGSGQIIGAQGGDSWVTSQSSAESINAKVKIVSLDSDRRYKTYGRLPGMS